MKKMILLAAILLLAAPFDLDRITLTVSPCYGTPEFLYDMEYTLDVQTGILLTNMIRQSDRMIMESNISYAEPEDVDALRRAMHAGKFFGLPEHIESLDALDGSYVYLTAQAGPLMKTCGGLNADCADNAAFVTVYEAFQALLQNAAPLPAAGSAPPPP